MANIFASRRAQLTLLILTNAISFYTLWGIAPVQESVHLNLGLTDTGMALLQGPAISIPVLLFGVPIGYLIDRFSRRYSVLAFATTCLLGHILSAFAWDFVTFFAARCIAGLGAFGAVITSFSLLADHYEPAWRGRAKAMLVVGQFAGRAGAFALAGMLLSDTIEASWRQTLLWMAIPVGIAMIPLLIMRDPGRKAYGSDCSGSPLADELGVRRALISPLIIGIIALEAALVAVSAWAAPAIIRAFSAPPSVVNGVLAAALLVGGMIGPLVGGFTADLTHKPGDPRRTINVICLMSVASIFASLFAVAGHIVLSGVLLALMIALVSAAIAAAVTLFTIVIPDHRRGFYLSIQSIGTTIFAGTLAPLVVSLVSAALGGASWIGVALCITCVGCTSLSCAALLSARVRVRQWALHADPWLLARTCSVTDKTPATHTPDPND